MSLRLKKAAQNREARLLCVVVLVHFIAVVLIFSRFDATGTANHGNGVLVVALPGSISAGDMENRHVELASQDLQPAKVLPSPTHMHADTPGSSNRPDPAAAIDHAASQSANNQNDKGQGGSAILSSSVKQLLPVRIDLPPSAKLIYNIKSVSNASEKAGVGQIFWQMTGNSFSISGEFGAQQANLLQFRSEGLIDPDNGLRPTIYSETWQDNSPTNTQFLRDKNTIVFPASFQPEGGRENALDPASVIWQLVNVGRRDSARYEPGAVFELQIAGSKGMEVWHVKVIGQEEIDTAIGRLQTWRLARPAAPDADSRALDIWLAPEKSWQPVKLRYSDASGNYLEMLISEIVLVPDR